jgi:hypothetical protein
MRELERELEKEREMGQEQMEEPDTAEQPRQLAPGRVCLAQPESGDASSDDSGLPGEEVPEAQHTPQPEGEGSRLPGQSDT